MLLNNRYRILRTLGSGGFGETFVAEDTQMPSGRWCVVKKLRPVSNDPQIHQLVNERFQREAAILEDLGSQINKIPKLYAYFEENGNFYLVQELIDGKTLAVVQQEQGIFSESYVKNFLSNFLPILDYIHNKQIIHRDIKPDNIIIRQSDNEPVLIDFGAVKESMGNQITFSGSQTSSIVIGTPGFMPSEQAAGRPVYSSDLYATGLTAVYLLTGKLPQDIETDYHTGEFRWKQYAYQVSPSLASILDRTIQPHARERYSTAKEMLQALQDTMSAYIKQPLSPTIVTSAPNNNSTTPDVSHTSKLGDLQKTLLIGSFISLAIIIGFWIIKQPQSVNISENPLTSQSPGNITESQTPSSFVPEAVPTISPSQITSIGWIRLGSVENVSGSASVGETLIATTQPVTISPIVVPRIGSQVTTITGVNLRRNVPQPPDYKLEEKISVLQPNQQLKIINLKTFVDTNSPSPYTVVWAEVGVP